MIYKWFVIIVYIIFILANTVTMWESKGKESTNAMIANILLMLPLIYMINN